MLVAVGGVVLLFGAAWWSLVRFAGRPALDQAWKEARDPDERPRWEDVGAAIEPLEDPGATTALRAPVPPNATVDYVAGVRPEERSSTEPLARGLVVCCEVLDEAGPVAGARVVLDLEAGGAATWLATLETDEAGRAEHALTAEQLAIVPLRARPASALLAHAEAPLHRSASAAAPWPWTEERCELRIELGTTAAVRGRVVDASGAPVAGAAVEALPPDGRGRAARSGRRPAGTEPTQTRRDGCFELPIEREARWCVRASANGRGVAQVAEVDVTPGVDVELGDLVLVGRGCVGGRTVDARGQPVAEVRVDAARVYARDATSHSPDAPERFVDGAERGTSLSAPDGTFRIEGLATGTYSLSTPHERSAEEGGTAPPHALGDEGAVLVVSRHRASIVVRDESGAPLPGADLFVRAGGRAASAQTDAAGRHVVHAAAGDHLVVAASLTGCAPAEAEHRFGAANEDVELALTLRALSSATGSLEVVVLDREGRPLQPAFVTLRTPLGNPVEEWYRRPLDTGAPAGPLAPGTYRVEVHAGRPEFGPFVESNLYFPTTVEVEVHEGETARLTVRCDAGGRVRVVLRVLDDAAAQLLAHGKLVRLTPAGDDHSLDVVYRVHDDGTVEYGGLPFEAGVPYVAAPLLAPGTHTLRFIAAGFRPLEHTFTIRAGEITDVELLLTRNDGE